MINKFKKLALFIAPVFLTVACSGMVSQSEVDALNEAEAVGSAFTQKLAEEYRAMANYEQNEMYDYPDALHFARKGLLSAQGENVLPEPIDNWNIPLDKQEDFMLERARLMDALDAGAREMAPLETALAQSRYDCWIEQTEEVWQEDEIAHCRDEYFSAMLRVEAMTSTGVEEPETITGNTQNKGESEEELEPIVSPPKLDDLTSLPNLEQEGDLALEEAMFLVFFDFDSSKVEAGAEDVVAAVAEEIRSRDDITKVIVKGHADTSGPADYNKKLSERRADAIKNALVEMGVSVDMLETRAFGETNLLVETPNDTREPGNRRGEITFE